MFITKIKENPIPAVQEFHEVSEIHDLPHHLQQKLQTQSPCGLFSSDPDLMKKPMSQSAAMRRIICTEKVPTIPIFTLGT